MLISSNNKRQITEILNTISDSKSEGSIPTKQEDREKSRSPEKEVNLGSASAISYGCFYWSFFFLSFFLSLSLSLYLSIFQFIY